MMITPDKDLVLKYMYPDYNEGDWEWVDMLDGNGPQFRWNRPEPVPTDEDVATNEAGALEAVAESQASTVSQADRDDATIAVLVEKVAELQKLAGITELTMDDVVASRDDKISAAIADRVQAVSVKVGPAPAEKMVP